MWDIPKDTDYVQETLVSLGADVPVCFAGHNARIDGIGDIFEQAPMIPEMPIVLVYPGKPCSTQDIFKTYDGDFREKIKLPDLFEDQNSLIDFLSRCHNDLKPASLKFVPDIENVLLSFDAQKGCVFSQMSGSGSCCFGLFSDEASAQKARNTISQENPDWWVRQGWIGRVERY